MPSLLKISLFHLFAALPLVTFNGFAQKEAIPFVHDKTYMLPSGKKVSVTFKERLCKSGECGAADGGTWGTDENVPRLITEIFLVSIDGRKFIIPEKFYKDLTNTHYLNVRESRARVVIELKGGESAGAYTAYFKLGGMCGFEREVCGEVCGEIWEKTIWYNSFAYTLDPKCQSGIQ